MVKESRKMRRAGTMDENEMGEARSPMLSKSQSAIKRMQSFKNKKDKEISADQLEVLLKSCVVTLVDNYCDIKR